MNDTIDCPKCSCIHHPSGNHESDATTWECDNCGFMFEVTIEYDPSYYTSCVTHQYGKLKSILLRKTDKTVTGRECKYCYKFKVEEE